MKVYIYTVIYILLCIYCYLYTVIYILLMKVYNVQGTVLGTDNMKVQYVHALKDLI